jgi:hypothetical protein
MVHEVLECASVGGGDPLPPTASDETLSALDAKLHHAEVTLHLARMQHEALWDFVVEHPELRHEAAVEAAFARLRVMIDTYLERSTDAREKRIAVRQARVARAAAFSAAAAVVVAAVALGLQVRQEYLRLHAPAAQTFVCEPASPPRSP